MAANTSDDRSRRGRILAEDVAAVKARLQIAEVISDYVEFKRSAGANLKALCPFHDERTASFNVTPAEGLFHCFGCGASGDVVAFIQQIEGMDFTAAVEHLASKAGLQVRYEPAATDTTPRRRAGKKSSKPQNAKLGRLPKRITTAPASEPACGPACREHEVTAYPYVDEYGAVLGEQVRLACVDPARSKCFVQRHVDERGRTVWRGWTPHVPYRLPEVVDGIKGGRTVWLTEGEKDADRLVELGEVATTNVAGAANFKPELAPYFAGAHVHVVLDRDEAGMQRYALIEQALRPVARSLRFSVPAASVAVDHADLSDHLDAGLSLADLAPLAAGEVAQLLALYDARTCAIGAATARDEARAQLARSRDATLSDRQRADGARYAERWAWDATQRIERVTKAYRAAQRANAGEAILGEIRGKHDDVVTIARESWAAASVSPPPAAQKILDQALTVASVGEAAGDDDGAVPDNVLRLRPGQGWHPEHSIRMSSGTWAYSTDERYRGVYFGKTPRSDEGAGTVWTYVSVLPHVRQRIIVRDGSGKRTDTRYLLALDDAGEHTTVVDRRMLREGQWASDLGVVLSHDDKIQRATATAIEQAAESAPEREATMSVKAGELPAVPGKETAPDGYLATADATSEDALADWRRIVGIVAEAPQVGFALAAAAVSPWLGGLDPEYQQSFILGIVGDPLRGKTITLQLAGGIYGDSVHPGGLVVDWNTTAIAPSRWLGSLGTFPAFFDEGALAQKSGKDWGNELFRLAQGGSRMAAARTGGLSRGLHWRGVLLTTANSSFADPVSTAGGRAGVDRRIVEINTPLTSGPAQAKELVTLLGRCYGHLAEPLLTRHTSVDVQRHIDAEAAFVAAYELTDQGLARAMIMQTILAGARLIDGVLGTGTQLRDTTAIVVDEILASWAPPLHDADRMLDAILDAMAAEPARWPTISSYRTNREPFNPDAQRGPAHGVDRSIHGVVDDDGRWVAVFKKPWNELVDELDVDRGVALRELDRRGLLQVSKQQRQRRREWTTKVRLDRPVDMYKLTLPQAPADVPPSPATEPELEDGPSKMSPPTGDVRGDHPECSGSVRDDVRGQNLPMTSDVRDVRDFAAPASYVGARGMQIPDDQILDERRPCEACGEECEIVVDGHVLHASCELPAPTETDRPEPPIADAAPEAAANRESEGRWFGPVIVADEDRIVLPDESSVPLPEPLTSLAQLGELTHEYSIGWGGGKTLPEPGVVVVTKALAVRLGLPGAPVEEDSAAHADTATIQAVLASRNGGWEITRRFAGTDELDWRVFPWMMFRAKGRRPFRVHLPHLHQERQRSDTQGLYNATTSPEDIVRLALRFAERIGIGYRLTPSVTGLDLITELRERSGRAAVLTRTVDGNPGQGPNRYFDLVTHRPPTDNERSMGFVHRWDANSAYLASCSRLPLGSDVPPEQLRPADPHELLSMAGYVKIRLDRDSVDLPELCPDPVDANDDVLRIRRNGPADPGWRWITIPKLRLLLDLGYSLDILDSWVWREPVPFLDQWYAVIRDGLYDAAELKIAGDPDGAVLRRTFKNLYAHGIGRLDRSTFRDPRPGGRESRHVMWRPDWRDSIIDETYRRTWLKVHSEGTTSGRWPVAINRDSLWYAHDDADPDAALPAGLKPHPYKLGHFSHEGSDPLPELLPFLDGDRPLKDAKHLPR